MVKLKGIIINLINFVKFKVCFYDYKLNFNSSVMMEVNFQLFLIKYVLVPWTTHVKGLYVQTKFLPVLDYWT